MPPELSDEMDILLVSVENHVAETLQQQWTIVRRVADRADEFPGVFCFDGVVIALPRA